MVKLSNELIVSVLLVFLWFILGTIGEYLCGNPCDNNHVLVLIVIVGFATMWPILGLLDKKWR